MTHSRTFLEGFLFPSLHMLDLTSLKDMIVAFCQVEGSFPGSSSQVQHSSSHRAPQTFPGV